LRNLLVVISGHREDLLAFNPSAISADPYLVSHAKITQEIKNVIGFHGRIQPFDNCLIHLFDGRERPIAVADDVGVTEMEVCAEPRIWHSLRRKSRDAHSSHQYLLSGRTNSSMASGRLDSGSSVSALPDPLDDLLNVISGFCRETRTHSLFLDGFHEFPKPHRLFPVSDQIGDKLSLPLLLLRDAAFLFFFLSLLLPSAMPFLDFLPVLLDGCGGYGEPTMKSPMQSSIRCCFPSAQVRRIGPMKDGRLAICN